MKKKISLVIFLIIISLVLTFQKEVLAATTDNTWGFAWTENIGWLKFNNCTNPADSTTCATINYGARIGSDGKLTGYIWSENIGWIILNPAGPYPSCPAGTCPAGSPNYSAQLSFDTKKVTGWARAYRAVNPEGQALGGWDGWILLGPIVKGGTDYGVYIDDSTSPSQLKGWAWGSDVVGWISFNCSNQGVCGTSNYKIQTSFSFNEPPSKPSSLSESWNNCAVQSLSVPSFNWSYSDPDGDSQAASQIKINGETALDTGELACPATCTSYTPANDWIRDNLSWNKSYTWQVRVKDSEGNWSVWSDLKSFTTPLHAYPWPNFTHTPPTPTVGEVVTFNDASKCYTSTNTERDCKDLINVQYAWDFDYQDFFTVDSTQKGNTTTTFAEVRNYEVRLRITDSSLLAPNNYCIGKGDSPVGAELPLPEYEEIPPVTRLKNFLAQLVDSAQQVKNFFRF